MADELQEVAEVEGEPETEVTADAETEPQENEGSESESETSEESESNEIKSERGQKRVQDLANKANKAKELEKEKETLEAKLAELEPLVAKKQEVDPLRETEDFAPKLTGDYESDIRTVEERASRKALESVQREQAKKDALIRDVYACEDAYPELRKGSEEYDEKLSNEVVQFYNELKAVNPDIRLKAVVDRIMRVKGYAAQKSQTKVAETLRQQSNESAVTPSNNLTQKAKPEEMSLNDIEKMVGTVRDY